MANLNLICDLKETFSKCAVSSAEGWKLLGQEQDGCILVSWEATSKDRKTHLFTSIGLYHDKSNILEVLYKFESKMNVIQASVNSQRTILLYITKESQQECPIKSTSSTYYIFHTAATIKSENSCTDIFMRSRHQIMAQFLYRKKGSLDRFLVFIHHECIALYHIDGSSDSKVVFLKSDIIASVFSWAQWDVEHQCLYYIYLRNIVKSDEAENIKNINQSPTLSALQFNDDFPHETVLNIPLNLPSTLESPFNTYEDEPIPLRVHDSSLDVIVLSDDRGIVSICHHYIYQPVKTPVRPDDVDEELTRRVHLAYSVTLLHHGTVLHCMVPGIPWAQANQLRPTFAIHKDDYMFVYLAGLFMHFLDMRPGHQPSCHILLPHSSSSTDHWIPLKTYKSPLTLVNLQSLQVFDLEISSQDLMKIFYEESIGLYTKLSIIHYFLVHLQDFDLICQLINSIAEHCLKSSLQSIFHEILVSGTYASVSKSLPSEATLLLRFLPLTTISQFSTVEIKSGSRIMTLSQEALWNPSVMLLSPQQRLHQFRTDLWTQLWNLIADTSGITRFKTSTVTEKLMVSLVCYQPEALSRCSTPLSPGSGFSLNVSMLECANIGNFRAKNLLPFYEVEKCTASKQELVISVNLRELSIHLVKHGFENPLQVHVVATRYASAQLEMSRFLCSLLTKSAAIPVHISKGFQLIDDLPLIKRRVFYSLLERYASAVDVLAYPLPQGFSSFFSYLGYKTLPFEIFVRYVQAKALTLQIDVMKVILPDLGDSPDGLKRRLRLLQVLPRSRAKRLLNQWPHPVSLMLRARDHSANILSGIQPRALTSTNRPPISSFKGLEPSYECYPPLDTFLDLLTAKASLAELDFNLLVEATMASVDRFMEST